MTRQARRLPVDTGVSGWNAIAGEMPSPRVLDHDIKADWLVIGAGIAGLAALGVSKLDLGVPPIATLAISIVASIVAAPP